jgi:hypothetical protein
MGNVINLADFKKKREEQEFHELNEYVKDIIKDLDTDPQPFTTQIPTGTFMYTHLESAPESEHRRHENIITCLDGLIFISVLLAKEKENDIVDKVDGVIADLEALLDKTLI